MGFSEEPSIVQTLAIRAKSSFSSSDLQLLPILPKIRSKMSPLDPQTVSIRLAETQLKMHLYSRFSQLPDKHLVKCNTFPFPHQQMAKNRDKDGWNFTRSQFRNVRVSAAYLLHCFADDLFVLLLCDFLPLVKGFYGCLHLIYSFLLDLLFLKQRQEAVGREKGREDKKLSGAGRS